ncbi:MAG: hypothetical protein WC878_00100 [Candidatus Paceibacterota bacterium]|jgi:hypothetical protein
MKLSKEQLLDCLNEHLPYEEMMLLETSKIPFDINQTYNNMIIESFAIHLRNFITFFYPKEKRYKTDICAENFFSNPKDWEKIRPTISQTLIDAKERADKQVGHITAERISGIMSPKKGWERANLRNEIIFLLKLFYNNADIKIKKIN